MYLQKQVSYQVPTSVYTIDSAAAAESLTHEPIEHAAEASDGGHPDIGSLIAAEHHGLIVPPARSLEAIDAWEATKRNISDASGDIVSRLAQSGEWVRAQQISERRVHSNKLQAIEKLYRVNIEGDALRTLTLQSSTSILFGMVSAVTG